MSSIFTTKEQYLAFRAQWRKLYADGFHKPVDVPQNYFHQDATGKWVDKLMGYHRVSPMHYCYHLVFNIATGRDPLTGIKGEPDKKELLSKTWVILSKQHSGKFFEPFGDSITEDQRHIIQGRVSKMRESLQ